MKKFLLTFILYISCSILHAQDTYLRWAKEMTGGDFNEAGQEIEVDKLGNVYTVGFFRGTVDFDPGPGIYNLKSAGAQDLYVSKLDANGNFVWARRIGANLEETAWTCALDASGNICIGGQFVGTVDFDPGNAYYPLTATGNYADGFILKLSSAGDFIWAKQIGGSFGVDIKSTSIDNAGSIYFSGSFWTTVDFDPGPGFYNLTARGNSTDISVAKSDIFLCKLNPNGDFSWAISLGGIETDIGSCICTDNSGNVYLTANFSNTADFDPGAGVYNITSKGLADIAIIKLNSFGELVWASAVGGTKTDYGYTPAVDAAGNIYLTGFFQGTADFDPGLNIFNLSSVSVNGDAAFVLKLSAAGDFIWARSMGGATDNNWGFDLALDIFGNVYTTGFYIGPADFDPGAGSFYLLSNGSADIFISKLNSNGDFVWAKSMGSGGIDQGLSIFIDKHANIYTTGRFEGLADFDPEIPVHNLTATNGSDIFVQKLAQCAIPSYTNIVAITCSNAYTLNNQSYTASGIYTQLLTNALGCDSIITLNLTIATTVFNAVNVSICQGQSHFAGGANQTTGGIYTDTLQTILGCDSIVTTTLSVRARPLPNLGPDKNLCFNSTVSISPGSFAGYRWHDNSIRPDFIVSNTGQYWVTVTDSYNCTATDTLKILAIDTIPGNFLPAYGQLCFGSFLNINVPGYKNYMWSSGELSAEVFLKNFGTYYLTVTDGNNCQGKDTITLQRNYNCVPVSIPNAFTPNKDGRNDIFRPIITQEITEYSFTVFNRYGQKIFETSNYGNGWDGSYKATAQPRNAYVYVVKFKNLNGQLSEYKGTVTLIR